MESPSSDAFEVRQRLEQAFAEAVGDVMGPLFSILQRQTRRAIVEACGKRRTQRAPAVRRSSKDGNSGTPSTADRYGPTCTDDALGGRTCTDLSRWSSAVDVAGAPSPAHQLREGGPSLGLSPHPKPPTTAASASSLSPTEGDTQTREGGARRSSSRCPTTALCPAPLCLVSVPRGAAEEAAARLAAALLMHGVVFDLCQQFSGPRAGTAALSPSACASALTSVLLDYPRRAEGEGDPIFTALAPMLLRVVAAEACGVVSFVFGHDGPDEDKGDAEGEGEGEGGEGEGGVSAWGVARPATAQPPPLGPTSSRPWTGLAARKQDEVAAIWRTMGCSTSAVSIIASRRLPNVTAAELEYDLKLMESVGVAVAGRQEEGGVTCVGGTVGEQRQQQQVGGTSPAKRHRGRAAVAVPGMTLSGPVATAIHTAAAATLGAAEQDWTMALCTDSIVSVKEGGDKEAALVYAVVARDAPLQVVSEAEAEELAARRFFLSLVAEDRHVGCLTWFMNAVHTTCEELCCLAATTTTTMEHAQSSPMRAFTEEAGVLYERLHTQQSVPQTAFFTGGRKREASESTSSLTDHKVSRKGKEGRAGVASPSRRATALPAIVRNPFSGHPLPLREEPSLSSPPSPSLPVGTTTTTTTSTEEATGIAFGEVTWLPLPHPLATPGPPVGDIARDVFGLSSLAPPPPPPPQRADGEDESDAETRVALAEVGAVLATVDGVFSARTVRDASAWRYGRNRVPVVAESTVFIARSKGEESSPAVDTSRVAATEDKEEKMTTPHTSDPPTVRAEGDAEPGEEGHDAEEDWRACARFMHETGLLYNANGEVFVLDVEATRRW